MDAAAIAGLVGLILVKELGVPLPVPGDLLIVGAGAYLAGDLPEAGVALALILLAGYIGASVQFVLFGTALRRPILAALERLGIGQARLESLCGWRPARPAHACVPGEAVRHLRVLGGLLVPGVCRDDHDGQYAHARHRLVGSLTPLFAP